MKISLLPLLLILPGHAIFAAEQAASSLVTAESPLSTVNLVQTLLALGLVIACIVLAGWLLKRNNRFHTAANGQLKVIAGIPLGTRERAILVQIGEEQLLLGVTQQQINMLYKLETPIKLETSAGLSSDFASKLRHIMQQRGQS